VASSGKLRELATGLLNGLNVMRFRRQPKHRLRLEIRAGASGHVVDADGEGVNRFGEREGSAELALLRGLVVIGICGEDGTESVDALQKAGLANKCFGAVVGAAAPDGDAAGSGLDDDADCVEPLVFFESCGLAS